MKYHRLSFLLTLAVLALPSLSFASDHESDENINKRKKRDEDEVEQEHKKARKTHVNPPPPQYMMQSQWKLPRSLKQIPTQNTLLPSSALVSSSRGNQSPLITPLVSPPSVEPVPAQSPLLPFSDLVSSARADMENLSHIVPPLSTPQASTSTMTSPIIRFNNSPLPCMLPYFQPSFTSIDLSPHKDAPLHFQMTNSAQTTTITTPDHGSEGKKSWKDILATLKTSLDFLVERHKKNIAQENQQEFKVQTLIESYKAVLKIEEEALAVVKFLTPFDEENIQKLPKLLDHLPKMREHFKLADEALQKVGSYYEQEKYESLEKELVKKRDNPELKEECMQLRKKLARLDDIQTERNLLSECKGSITAEDRWDDLVKTSKLNIQ